MERETANPREEKVQYNTLSMAYLMFEEKPVLPGAAAIARRMDEAIGDVEKMGGSRDMLAFIFNKYQVQYKEGFMPAQSALFDLDKLPDLDYDMIRLQSRQCEAGELLPRFRHALLYSEFMALGLPRKERAELFSHALQLVLEFFPDCIGILFPSAQQIIPVHDYLKSNDWSRGDFDPLYGMVNVRLFNLQNTGEKIMDTVGLHVFGLPDLQCHFNELDLNSVAGILFRYADYFFQKGDVIENGDTIDGIFPESRWICTHQEALIPPHRIVVDLNPGSPWTIDRKKHEKS